MEGIAYLDANFDEVVEDSAVLRLEYTDELLIISSKSITGDWLQANPFSFGRFFPKAKEFGSENLLKLRRFVVKVPGGAYARPFPYEEHIKRIVSYGVEELGTKIPKPNALLLAQLYHSSFPVFWEWSKSTCIIYDGFYDQFAAGNYEKYFSETTYEGIVKAIFGVVRKDTLRETRGFNFNKLSLAFTFQGLLPVDIILDVLKNTSLLHYDFPLNQKRYSALNRLSRVQVRLLMESMMNDSDSDIFRRDDALTMLLEVPDQHLKKLKGVRCWSDLHDRVMRLVNVDDDDKSTVQIPKLIMALAATGASTGLKLTPLVKANDFIRLGETLNICIGKSTYFAKARQGESYCLAGFDGVKPALAIEIASKNNMWKVLQYRGMNNSSPANSAVNVKLIESFLNTFEAKTAIA